jgi:hypothetical protein
VGSIDTGDMDSPILATSPVINSMIIVSQVRFGSIEFLPHPPSLLPVFENMDHGMDLPIGSLSFRVGSRGSICLSDPICSGPSAIDEAPTRATSSTDSSNSFDYNSMEVSFDSEVVTNSCHRKHHHVYAIITGDSGEGSKEFDDLGNPLVNPDNLPRGRKYQA